MLPYDLPELEGFVAVAEALHFGRAADRLHLAQPALTRRVQRLERAVGAPLLTRTKRQVALTPAGAEFLGHARRIVAAVHDSVDAARRADRGETGRLRVGFEGPSAQELMPVAVRAFRERHPGVDVSLAEMTTARQVEALAVGDLDVGFLVPPVADDAVAYEVVVREPLVVVLPSAHPLARRARVRASDLAREPFVLFTRALGCGLNDEVWLLCRAAGFSPRVGQEVTDMVTLLGLVAAGAGVSILPASVKRFARRDLAVRTLAGTARAATLALAWARESPSAQVRAFRAVVDERAKERSADAAA
jgi:DNA-binding transcriptional LysR family regulator